MKKHNLCALLLTLSALLSQNAWAHTLPVDNGTINVNDDTAYLVLSLPVQALTEVDDNDDGKLSYDELTTHNDAVRAQITAGFEFINQRDSGDDSQRLSIVSLTPTVEQNSVAHSHEPLSEDALKAIQATHLTALAVVRFSQSVQQLQVNSDFFKTTADGYQFTLFAKHADAATQAGKVEREQATLSAEQTTATFFQETTGTVP